jgi:hypothetical protein
MQGKAACVISPVRGARQQLMTSGSRRNVQVVLLSLTCLPECKWSQVCKMYENSVKNQFNSIHVKVCTNKDIQHETVGA